MSHKDEATREALASELAQLKDKYSRLERAYNAVKDDAAENNGKSR
ncbi:hypothetical protein JCM17380_42070 [Desulfosporosinus burensis]